MTSIPSPRLSDIEQYLLFDNHPAFPLDFSYRLSFDSQLDLSLLEESVGQALMCHPLLSATVQQRGRRWYWVPQPVVAKIHSVDSLDGHFCAPIDLQNEPGVRIFAAANQGQTVLVFVFHHTATDGLGAMSFISDVLRLCSGIQVAERDTTLLKQRHRCGYPKDGVLNYVRKHITAAKLAREFVNAKICPLVKRQPDRTTPRTSGDCTKSVSHTFSAQDTASLKNYAQGLGVSLNSLLIRDAFVTFDAIRQTFQDYAPEEYFRIAVPGDTRPRNTERLIPAANFFSMIFPLKNAKQIANEDRLLQEIHEDVRSARKDYFLAIFRLSLKVLRRIPGGLQREVNADKCHVTMLLTNVGLAFSEMQRPSEAEIRIRDARLVRAELIAPIRPFQTVAMSAIEYAGAQTLTLTYDPRVHNDSEASCILRDYTQQLERRIK